SVNPSTIQQGQSASLSWETSNATDVSIDSLGAVPPSGSRSVSPSDSTNYHLVAKGAGGTQDATTRLTVTVPPPPPPPPAGSTDEELFAQYVKDIYFDYDKSDIRADQQSSIQADVQFLTQHANMNLTIEGHCDERGSTEYNVALGEPTRDSRQECADGSGDRRQPHQHDQLRQRKTLLQRKQRSLLAAEPPRPFRLSEVRTLGERRFCRRSPIVSFE